MLRVDINKLEIAEVIKRDKSVIPREISRNKDKRSGEYKHDLANRKYHYRHKAKPKDKRFIIEVRNNVERLLREDYSPKHVEGTLKNQGIETVSIERVYQYIWQDKK